MDRTRAFHLIEAATAVQKMLPNGNVLPIRESHVRQLLKLETDEEYVQERWDMPRQRPPK